MELILIRHAHAGERTAGGRDQYRMLSERGHDQAQRIAEIFADTAVVGVLSSPATRCVQTVQPLADARGLTVIEDDALWETADYQDVLACLASILSRGQQIGNGNEPPQSNPDTGSAVVICSHGNIIPTVVETAAAEGAEVHGRGCERASAWVVDYQGNLPITARYLSPRKDYQIKRSVSD